VIERIRSSHFSVEGKEVYKDGKDGSPQMGTNVYICYVIELLDLLANAVFVAGSVCFLPRFEHSMDVFLLGCGLFIAGSVLYCCITLYTLLEVLYHTGYSWAFETVEHILYLMGSVLYLVGTVMYWPSEVHRYHLTWLAQHLSLGVYFNIFSTQFEGTILFMVGSVLFAFAAFVNGLSQRSFDSTANRLLTCITSLYLGGSVLFVMGSGAMLPEMNCGDEMTHVGAILFVIGSALFLFASFVSMYRTRYVICSPQNQPLMAASYARGAPSVDEEKTPTQA